MTWQLALTKFFLPAVPLIASWVLKEWPTWAALIPAKYQWVVSAATGVITYTMGYILLHMQPPKPAPPPVQ